MNKIESTNALPHPNALTRRDWLKRASTVAAGMAMGPAVRSAEGNPQVYRVSRGRIQQSVIPWCFNPMSPEELIGHAARMGLKSVELIGTEHWPLLKKHGLICAITGSHGFAKGFARREEHAECLAKLRSSIDTTAAEGWSNVITFSGFRRGVSTEEGVKNMVSGLKQIAGYAEQKNRPVFRRR